MESILKHWRTLALLMLTMLASSGCTWLINRDSKHVASLSEYLFPKDHDAYLQPDPQVKLRLPVRVGIAFVPSDTWQSGLSETARMQMLTRVRDAFATRKFIREIEVIPSEYLKPQGGFTNLEQAAHMFNVDVVVLLSYDQMQFGDDNMFSVLYWTIVGAYVIQGSRYDVSTMLDAAVFDVTSHKLLFRAPGVSTVKGSATLNSFSEQARTARSEGFDKALDALIPELDRQLNAFSERVKNGTAKNVQVEYRPGYNGGGALDGGSLDAAALCLGAVLLLRRRSA